MNKQSKRIRVITAIVFIVFQVLVFTIPFEKTVVFWIGYLFGMIAIIGQIYVLKVAFDNTETLKSKFYGFPIVKIGAMYLVIQLIASFIFMIGAVVIPVQVAIVICTLLLAVAAIGTITTDGLREELIRQDSELKTDVTTMRNLQSQINALVTICKDEQMVKQIKVLAEEIKYSDPVSNDKLHSIEANLIEMVSSLQEAVLEQDNEGAEELLVKLHIELVERNRLCKLSK